jgi:predicted DNA-binding transcriptional regulator AlpA
MDDEYLDVKAACRFIGGTKPIDPSTLWRNVKAGRYSPPDHVGPNMVRWRRSQLARDLERIAADKATRRRDETAA